MLASKVGLVISGADHKLSITELNHSRGKNNVQMSKQHKPLEVAVQLEEMAGRMRK